MTTSVAVAVQQATGSSPHPSLILPGYLQSLVCCQSGQARHPAAGGRVAKRTSVGDTLACKPGKGGLSAWSDHRHFFGHQDRQLLRP